MLGGPYSSSKPLSRQISAALDFNSSANRGGNTPQISLGVGSGASDCIGFFSLSRIGVPTIRGQQRTDTRRSGNVGREVKNLIFPLDSAHDCWDVNFWPYLHSVIRCIRGRSVHLISASALGVLKRLNGAGDKSRLAAEALMKAAAFSDWNGSVAG